MSTAESTPDLLGAAVGPMIVQLDVRRQRILLAILERMAAQSYRSWAAQVEPAASPRFLEAAANEDGIAEILEALDPDHAALEAELHARFPHLDGLFGSVLDGRPLREQLALQMAAEAGAAGLFRAFADAETDPAARARLLACSSTEQANSDFLRAELGA